MDPSLINLDCAISKETLLPVKMLRDLRRFLFLLVVNYCGFIIRKTIAFASNRKNFFA